MYRKNTACSTFIQYLSYKFITDFFLLKGEQIRPFVDMTFGTRCDCQGFRTEIHSIKIIINKLFNYNVLIQCYQKAQSKHCFCFIPYFIYINSKQFPSVKK